VKESLFKTTLGRLRITGLAEGTSFLILLCIAMPLKYMLGLPQAVRVVGMIHGLLFILYVYFLFRVYSDKKFPLKTIFVLFLASLIPFGTFYTDVKILQN